MKSIYFKFCCRFLCFILFLSVLSCTKVLDVKPDKKMVIINSLRDLQALLENYNWVNRGYSIGEAGSDNYYITSADYARLSDEQRNFYKWNPEMIFRINATNSWSGIYDNVYRANTVLFNLDKILRTKNDELEWNNVKGQALFLRAKSFLSVATVWSLGYDNQTASKDLGIPLRLDPNFNLPSVRSNLSETFAQILGDLKESIDLLPVTSISSVRPAQPAATALLARTYLYMREYDSAYKYANLSLKLKDGLIDFNTLNTSDNFPFRTIFFDNNPEVIHYSSVAALTMLQSSFAKVDSTLYQSYNVNDLRKEVYFRTNGNGTYFFRGSYLGSPFFDGISTPETYLIRSECAIRLGNISEGLGDLNLVLRKRWRSGRFSPLTSTNQQEVLGWVLAERRKELAFRDLRWMDIKRLNKEGAGIILKRVILNETFLLPPNDLRYAMAIPEDIIAMTGMPQNPR